MSYRKRILFLDLLSHGSPSQENFTFEGNVFNVEKHSIGWDLELAKRLIKNADGFVDGICLSGIYDISSIDGLRIHHLPTHQLINVAQETPVYTGQELREFFAGWTLKKHMKRLPNLFNGRRVLFQCASVTPCLRELISTGCIPYEADLLTFMGMPMRLQGVRALKNVIRTMRPLIEKNTFRTLRRGDDDLARERKMRTLRQWVRECDVFVTFRALLDRIGPYDALEGKTLLIDALTQEQWKRLRTSGVGRVIELIPQQFREIDPNLNSFALLHCFLDQGRRAQAMELRFDEYLLDYLERNRIAPNDVQIFAPVEQRCAFVIHPLDFSDFAKAKYLRWVLKLPKRVKELSEYSLARGPGIKFGEIKGIRSELTGLEVVCDLYAVLATPQQMRKLDENFLYDKLIRIAHLARKNGDSMIGLGAYTKVVGDAGITVAHHSPIPVTNGNSYSAAATLWAARHVSEKMGIIPIDARGRIEGRAMVVGATGGIGKVSSMLLASKFHELILVARRLDKLLELKAEILRAHPNCNVKVSVDPTQDLRSTDLIITATSNEGGKLIDIWQVKPGAVICDCSRPLDFTEEDAKARKDILIIESGEIDLPGKLIFKGDIGLPYPSVYACLAETVLLTMEGTPQSFSLGKDLSLQKVKEIYKLGIKHGAKLSAIRGPLGFITDDDIKKCRELALQRLRFWKNEDGEARSNVHAFAPAGTDKRGDFKPV